MTSWRDWTSTRAQDDLDGLLNATLPFAEQMLQKQGEFFPFGASIDRSGDTAMLAADPGLGEHPDSTAVLDTMYDGARSRAGELRAVVFVADVLANGADAVRLELEHAEGTALIVQLPYSLAGRFRRTVTFGEMAVAEGARKVWF